MVLRANFWLIWPVIEVGPVSEWFEGLCFKHGWRAGKQEAGWRNGALVLLHRHRADTTSRRRSVRQRNTQPSHRTSSSDSSQPHTSVSQKHAVHTCMRVCVWGGKWAGTSIPTCTQPGGTWGGSIWFNYMNDLILPPSVWKWVRQLDGKLLEAHTVIYLHLYLPLQNVYWLVLVYCRYLSIQHI